MVDENEVITMYGGGMSTNDIALEMDVSPKTVRAILEAHELLQKPGRKSSAESFGPEERTEMIREYLEDKTPAVQLIQKYALTWNAFYKVLDEEQVPYREMKQEDRISREMRLDRAVQMYMGGARIWEIENETGIRQPVLHATLHKRGVTLRRVVSPPD
jgi:transposase